MLFVFLCLSAHERQWWEHTKYMPVLSMISFHVIATHASMDGLERFFFIHLDSAVFLPYPGNTAFNSLATRFSFQGADIEEVTACGQHCIHLAANYIKEKALKLLIDKGCEVDATDAAGNTALHWSVCMHLTVFCTIHHLCHSCFN